MTDDLISRQAAIDAIVNSESAVACGKSEEAREGAATRQCEILDTNEQLSLLPILLNGEEEEGLKRQEKQVQKNAKEKRNWENAFQRWSNKQSQNGDNSCGCCGYGSMCDWCEDNAYGRPCVRALNDMLREKRQKIDYSKRDFEAIWYGGGS